MPKLSKSQKKSKRRKLSKLLNKLPEIKKRIPISPPTKVFKSIKNYNRSQNKKIVKKELNV